MPKLWTGTIEEHRAAVRDATLDAAAALVAERGVAALTMSQLAEHAGIGRATLYKYFADVDAVLNAWHEREVARHLEQLRAVSAEPVSAQPGDAGERLRAVLETYAFIRYDHRDHDLAPIVHRGHPGAHAEDELHGLIKALVAGAATAGDVRDDVAPAELATWCLHALRAATDARSRPAVRRLVAVTVSGLQPT